MPTLGTMPTREPELELTFANRCAAATLAVEVTGVLSVTPESLLEDGAPATLPRGYVVLIADAIPFRLRGRITTVLETLLHRMSRDGSAGLIVSATPGARQPFPPATVELSERQGIPSWSRRPPSNCGRESMTASSSFGSRSPSAAPPNSPHSYRNYRPSSPTREPCSASPTGSRGSSTYRSWSANPPASWWLHRPPPPRSSHKPSFVGPSTATHLTATPEPTPSSSRSARPPPRKPSWP